jgi:hypothetical protein
VVRARTSASALGHRPAALAQPSGGVHRRQQRSLERFGEPLGVVASTGWSGTVDPAPGRPPVGFEHRYPPAHELAERLADPLDVAGPVVAAGPGIGEAALVDREPPGQRAVVQATPDGDAAACSVAQQRQRRLDGFGIVAARARFQPGPIEHQPHVSKAGLGQQAQIVGTHRRPRARRPSPSGGFPRAEIGVRGGTDRRGGRCACPPPEVLGEGHGRHPRPPGAIGTRQA